MSAIALFPLVSPTNWYFKTWLSILYLSLSRIWDWRGANHKRQLYQHGMGKRDTRSICANMGTAHQVGTVLPIMAPCYPNVEGDHELLQMGICLLHCDTCGWRQPSSLTISSSITVCRQVSSWSYVCCEGDSGTHYLSVFAIEFYLIGIIHRICDVRSWILQVASRQKFVESPNKPSSAFRFTVLTTNVWLQLDVSTLRNGQQASVSPLCIAEAAYGCC